MTRLSPLGKATTRVVVITGGSSGIGRCTAILFAQRGWRIGLIARGEQGLAASRRDVEAAGACAATAQADVADSKSLAKAANAHRGGAGPHRCLDQLRRQRCLWPLGRCVGAGVPTGDRRDLPRHGQWHAGSALPYAQAGARRYCECLFGYCLSRFASDVVLRRCEGGRARLWTSDPRRIEVGTQPCSDQHRFSASREHTLFQPRPQPYGVACPPRAPGLSAGGGCAGDMAGDGERAGGNDHHRYGGDFLAGDEARTGSDGLVCRANGVRATVDPRARGLRSPGDDLVRTLAARVHRARAVRTTGTRMERTALVRRGAERGRKPAGEGMARRYVKRSVACQTRSKRSGSKARRFGGTARRPLR